MKRIAVTITIIMALFGLAACASQTAAYSETSSESTGQSGLSENDGMKAVEIDNTTLALIEGTWRTKGIWFDANDPIKPLDENKNLNDLYGRYSITFNADKTFKFQKRNALEEGVWEYYGIESDMRCFAMKTASGAETGDGGGVTADGSNSGESAFYYVYLKEMDSNNMIVVHEQGNAKEDAKPVMVKTSGGEQTADTSASSNSEPNTTNHAATTGEKNALSKALSYLDMTAFSFSGLVEQLEYEGFSHAEAIYGADNCGADWNEQAARKAKQYLDMTSFSRSGLVEQLEFEGFTHSQAEYGVSKVY